MWKFQFCSLFFYLFSSSSPPPPPPPSSSLCLCFLSLMLNSKLYRICKWSAHQTIALLSEIFFLGVSTACELRLARYSSKRASWSPSNTPFFHKYRHNSKLKIVLGRSTYQMAALLSEISIFWVKLYARYDRWVIAPNMHRTSFQYDILCVHTFITPKLQVIYERSPYEMTVLLSEMCIICVRPGYKVQLVSYGSKLPSHFLFGKPFVHTSTHSLKWSGYCSDRISYYRYREGWV